jgi:hypothetical protein
MRMIPVKFYYQRARVLGYLMVFCLLTYFIFQLFSKN